MNETRYIFYGENSIRFHPAGLYTLSGNSSQIRHASGQKISGNNESRNGGIEEELFITETIY